MPVRIKRIYDDPQADDGDRILVDRVWPRGCTKEQAKLDEWIKMSLRRRNCADGSPTNQSCGHSSGSATFWS